MKKTGILAVSLVVLLLWGCNRTQHLPEPTTATLPPLATEEAEPWVQPYLMTRSGRILETLWRFYDGEKFSCYGGSGDTFIAHGPGELSFENADVLIELFFLPAERLEELEEGASLMHMLQQSQFTCGVFRVSEGISGKAFAQAWRENIHRQAWVGGKPERLLIMELDSQHLLLVLGKREKVQAMENAAKKVFSGSKALFREGIAG